MYVRMNELMYASLDTQALEVDSPWVRRPQAQCSTGSSNLCRTEK